MITGSDIFEVNDSDIYIDRLAANVFDIANLEIIAGKIRCHIELALETGNDRRKGKSAVLVHDFICALVEFQRVQQFILADNALRRSRGTGENHQAQTNDQFCPDILTTSHYSYSHIHGISIQPVS